MPLLDACSRCLLPDNTEAQRSSEHRKFAGCIFAAEFLRQLQNLQGTNSFCHLLLLQGAPLPLGAQHRSSYQLLVCSSWNTPANVSCRDDPTQIRGLFWWKIMKIALTLKAGVLWHSLWKPGKGRSSPLSDWVQKPQQPFLRAINASILLWVCWNVAWRT